MLFEVITYFIVVEVIMLFFFWFFYDYGLLVRKQKIDGEYKKKSEFDIFYKQEYGKFEIYVYSFMAGLIPFVFTMTLFNNKGSSLILLVYFFISLYMVFLKRNKQVEKFTQV